MAQSNPISNLLFKSFKEPFFGHEEVHEESQAPVQQDPTTSNDMTSETPSRPKRCRFVRRLAGHFTAGVFKQLGEEIVHLIFEEL